MRYYSHYIWESGSEEKDSPISVVLQQVSEKKNHYLLACVCDGRYPDAEDIGEQTGEKKGSVEKEKRAAEVAAQISSYFAERLTEWFHKCFLKLILRKKIHCYDIYKYLEKEISRIQEELKEYCEQKRQPYIYNVQGILLCDDYFCLFQKGNAKCYVFNRRFNLRRRKDLSGTKSGELELIQGNAQKKIGILLCTSGFGLTLTETDMINVLFEEPLNDRKIGKRLREIRLSDLEQGSTEPAGAVFIYLE